MLKEVGVVVQDVVGSTLLVYAQNKKDGSQSRFQKIPTFLGRLFSGMAYIRPSSTASKGFKLEEVVFIILLLLLPTVFPILYLVLSLMQA